MHFVGAHCNALAHLGGAPAIVVCDNLRSGVTRSHRYEPDVNATYQEMAGHYGMAIIPARSYKPRDKSKAESGVLLAERWIMARLRNRRFTSLGAANAEIAGLVDWVNDRPFKKLPGSRRSVFAALDQPALRPLPASAYEFATWRRAKVNIDYHIEVRADRHYYSVPYRLVGDTVEVRISQRSIEIFSNHRRVASHVRHYTPGFSTDPAHMPESHRRHAEWTPGRIVAFPERTGPAVAKLAAEILAERPHPEQGYRTWVASSAWATVTDRSAWPACARALAIRAHSYRSVESILRNGLDTKPLPAEGPGLRHPDHGNVRGPDYYR